MDMVGDAEGRDVYRAILAGAPGTRGDSPPLSRHHPSRASEPVELAAVALRFEGVAFHATTVPGTSAAVETVAAAEVGVEMGMRRRMYASRLHETVHHSSSHSSPQSPAPTPAPTRHMIPPHVSDAPRTAELRRADALAAELHQSRAMLDGTISGPKTLTKPWTLNTKPKTINSKP